MKKIFALSLALLFLISLPALAGEQRGREEKKSEETKLNAGTFAGLQFRAIGPALMSGRVSDMAVDPTDRSIWYATMASGNIWKTTNAGITWDPIFDNYSSYSIGCITIDPNNHLVLWIGTGENNSQRSVAYGDGVYKSLDGGRSWTNVGLKNSEHIGKIIVDPRDSNVVYVAAQGPLWAPGGDRGLYKTTDGGATWNKVLEISENTGVSEVHFDPRNHDVLYAAAYQRRRHVWTLINGGPESAIYKSYDGGANWKKLSKGLPRVDMGRIGMSVSPINPDVVYAIVEAAEDAGGFFRSEDGGENWSRQSDYVSGSPQYYQEIFADPHVFDRIYSLDTFMMVSEDGGKTFNRLGEQWKHVDNHALVFDPDDPEHLIIGCDGGIYETFDRGTNYRFFGNLPTTQFYKLDVDNDFPFYHVYGGTQDNNTQGGPVRTNNVHGIRNSDWYITVGGDGFQPRIDPKDPNIVYSQSQYGNLARYDRKSGETVDIQPQPEKGGEALRFNWDSPLIISPHSNTRLYYGSQILFRSDDRGDTWTAVSTDLTRQIDRNKLEVMGTVWGVDTVSKNRSTSFYGTLVSLTESPLQEGLIYAGTDDGLVQVTEDGGQNWRKIEKFPGIPENTYVAYLEASLHDPDTVFAAFNNHKKGDFKPYILKSTDRGDSWTSISGDLPDRHVVWAVKQDHERADLLFAGTEFGIFFTVDGGEHWIQFKGGLPTISFRDLAIQRRENDLVGASFGRSFYVLDDYTPLRSVTPELLEEDAYVFPVKNAWMFIQARPLGGGEKASQGAAFFTAPNPPFGAVFTYYLKESMQTNKQVRQKAEQELRKEGEPVYYPTWDELKTEDREEEPTIILTVTDEAGNVVRRIAAPASSGIHRVSWDLTYPPLVPTTMSGGRRFGRGASGPMIVPGTYTVSMAKFIDGVLTPMGEPQSFETVPLGLATLEAEDKEEVLAFQKQTAELLHALLATNQVARDAAERIDQLKNALQDTPAADPALMQEARRLELQLMDLQEALTGDPTKPRRSEPAPPSIMSRVQRIVYGHWSATSGPTNTHRRNYEIAAEEFELVLGQLRSFIEVDLKNLEDAAEAAGAPWTPGRGLPDWKRQ